MATPEGAHGAKAGDEVTIRTVAAVATLTTVSAYCVADGVVRIVFQSQANGTREIASGTGFNITSRGPW